MINIVARTRLVEKAEQLHDAAYRLLRAPSGYNVNGFYSSTYLAFLSAGTVMTIGKPESRPFDDDAQWRRMLRLAQSADESIAQYSCAVPYAAGGVRFTINTREDRDRSIRRGCINSEHN